MSAFSQRAVAIGATAAFFGVLFGLAQSGAEPCPTQCASGKIPLGITAPTSGQAVASAFGAQFVKPVEIAVRELNAAGGLMGMPVDLAIADDRCEPGPAINVANRQVDGTRSISLLARFVRRPRWLLLQSIPKPASFSSCRP
jgi:ABC-type branched-subunit amino acid transport system substrate-binding protein